jgi:hypothetical protein
MFENTKRVEGHTKQCPCDKDRAPGTQAKTECELIVSWGVIHSCSTRNTRRVIFVINVCHKWGKHQFVITTNRKHPRLFVTHILHSGYESHCDDFNLATFLMRGTTTPTGTSDGCAVQIKYTFALMNTSWMDILQSFKNNRCSHMSNKLLPVVVGGVLHNGWHYTLHYPGLSVII